jgi:hypothetical protein
VQELKDEGKTLIALQLQKDPLGFSLTSLRSEKVALQIMVACTQTAAKRTETPEDTCQRETGDEEGKAPHVCKLQ